MRKIYFLKLHFKLSHRQVVCEDTNHGTASVGVPTGRNYERRFEMRFFLTCLFILFVSNILGQTNIPNNTTSPPQVSSSSVNPLPSAYNNNIPQNYLRTWAVKKPTSDISEIVSSIQLQDVSQSTDYTDGLGRPLQKVVRGVTPSGKDLVSTKLYDSAGREVFNYLPYPSTNGDGKIKFNPFAEQVAFMQSQPQYAGEQVFYSQTVFDNSPLSNVEKTMAPGNSFAGRGRGNEIKYETNGANEVRIWNINAAINSIPTVSGYYDAASLNRTITIDPASKRVVEYKDKEGRQILKKVEIKHNGNADISGYDGWLSTYYIYDDVSNLRFTITPKAIEWLIANNWTTLSADIINELCFRYDYDDNGRAIIKKAPGAAEEYTVYDKKDRAIFSQDGNLRAQSKWIAILYDLDDRQFMIGIINYTGDRNQLQDYANANFVNGGANSFGLNNSVYGSQLQINKREVGRDNYKATQSIEFLSGFESESNASFVAEIDNTVNTENISYGGVVLPPGNNFDMLTTTYYDNYNWIASANAGFPSALNTSQLQGNWMNTANANQYPYPLPVETSQQTQDLKTGTKVKVLSGSIPYLYSVNFYDEYGHAIQVYSTNPTGGHDIFTTQYSYDGKILASHQNHFKAGANSQTHDLYTRFEFDNAGRVTNTFKRINNQPEKLLSSNTYNELSQLTTTILSPTGGAGGGALETLDYTYNLQGSMKGMNEAFVNAQNNDRFFGEVLSRDFGFTQPQYTGNIAGAKWRSIGDGEQRAYGYAYDASNRLLKADFTQFSSPTGGGQVGAWNTSANVDFTMRIGDGFNPLTAYDANGNIKALWQKGLKVSQSDVIDNLTYNYQYANYSNKLRSIDESAGGGTSAGAAENILADFKDGTNGTTDDYDYDANGNTVTDRNKNIAASGSGGITYNYLNLPTLVKVDGKGEISYVYDATGERLQKITQPLSGSSNIYTYVGPFTYRDDELQYIYTEEGRIRPITLPSGGTGWAYDYFIKDHLGNIRMILTDEQRTDPYPTVSFEDGTVPDNPDYYDREEIGITARPQSFGDNNTNGLKVQLLRKNAQSLGVSKLLKVMVKDKINVQVDYYFPTQTVDNSGANGINSLVTILSSLLNAANAPPLIKGNGGTVTSQLNNNVDLNSLLSPQNASSGGTLPKAYLNIIFFDEQFRFINQSSRIVPVTIADSRQQIIQTQIEVPKNGYVYVYVSNESNNLVYFDNFQISHTRGPVLEEDHYYPLGGKMTGICSHALPGIQNSLDFQSKELDEEFDLDWYDFEARNYDPQIGRFLQLDPKDQFASGYVGMGNSWIMGVDPDGQFFHLIIGAIVGAVVNVVGNIGNIHSVGDFFGYLGVGAAAGVVAAAVPGPGGWALAGAITSGGNALVGGASLKEALGQTIVGAATGLLGGIGGSALNGVVSSTLSTVVGSTATKIASTIVTSTIVGGAMGAGMATITGGNAWQGALQGMRNGAITGAISATVPMAINAMKRPPPAPLPRSQSEIAVQETSPPIIKNNVTIPEGLQRNSLWNGPHGGINGSGQTIQSMTIDEHYSGWTNLKFAKGIDGISKSGDAVVQIKTTGYYGKTSATLPTTKIIDYFNSTNYQTKILHVVTPLNFRITNIQQVMQQMNANGIRFTWTHLR